MSPIPLLIAGIAVFLVVIGVWGFGITSDLGGIGMGGVALGFAALAAAALAAAFVWLGRRNRMRQGGKR